MLRECIRYEALTKILLNAENFYDFFKYVEVSTFDIASDAFATFKVRRLINSWWGIIIVVVKFWQWGSNQTPFEFKRFEVQKWNGNKNKMVAIFVWFSNGPDYWK